MVRCLAAPPSPSLLCQEANFRDGHHFEWSGATSRRVVEPRATSDHKSQMETLLHLGLGRELVGMKSMTPQEGEEDGTQ
jgi:hypothetical protein